MAKTDKPAPVASSVSDATRRMIDAPEEALRAQEDDAARMDELLSMSGAIAAQSPLHWVAPSIRRRAAKLRAGRNEARTIAAMLDAGEIGNLRAHLKEHPPSPECVIWLLHDNRRLSASLAASKAAASKNADARAYVLSEWRKRSDPGQSRASFARMMAPQVRRHHGVTVTPDRIARYWLKDE